MTKEEALAIVLLSLKKATKTDHEGITEDTDLINEDIIDSLDSMTILFEMEENSGLKLGVDEDYSDYKVSSLMQLVLDAS